MANPALYQNSQLGRAQPGVDLRWPASVLWRDGEPEVRKIELADLRVALTKGLDDFKAIPTHAIFLCLIYPIAGFVLYRLIFGYQMLPLVYPVAAGFALLGPLAAIGLYELSRRRERGLDVSASRALDVLQSPSIGAIARLGLVLAAIFVAWLYCAQLVYTQIFGPTPPDTVHGFLQQIRGSKGGMQLILAGNVIGFLFAAFVLVISFVSFPLLVDRNVSAATAVRTSVRAAIDNPIPVAAWGLIVAVALLLGALPFLIGLTIVLPVLGHATWHVYRRIVAP